MTDKIDLGTLESPSRPLPEGQDLESTEAAHARRPTPQPPPTRPLPTWCFIDRPDNPKRFRRRMD